MVVVRLCPLVTLSGAIIVGNAANVGDIIKEAMLTADRAVDVETTVWWGPTGSLSLLLLLLLLRLASEWGGGERGGEGVPKVGLVGQAPVW